MIVRLSSEARDDLRAIARWIAKDSPRHASTFVRALRGQCEALGEQPEAFPVLPRYERAGIRRRAWRDYLIFYQVKAGQVMVLHVLHGARDYESLLSPDA